MRRPSESRVARIAEALPAQALTYAEVGATRGALPAGFRHDRLTVDLGPDDGDRFRRACDAVRTWAPQRAAGIQVHPETPVHVGADIVLVMEPVAMVHAVATARIVYVVDEPGCWGYAYGTLPDHPECGEEAFLVVREDGRIRFILIAFSRPRALLGRLGGPITRAIQMRALNAYIAAVALAAR